MDDLEAAFKQVWHPTPPLLYRYVPHDRAQAIRNGYLWAANIAKHSTDSDMHEFRLGWNMIRSTAESIGHQTTDETLSELCKRIAHDANPFDDLYVAYAVCLTSQPNDDRMRVHAGNDRSRFAFRSDELVSGVKNHIFPDNGRYHVSLLKVHYEADDLLNAVDHMIRRVVLPRINQRKETAAALDSKAAANTPFYALRNVFVPMALSFKRGQFRWEHEWRLVLTRPMFDTMPAEHGIDLRCADDLCNTLPLPIQEECRVSHGALD